MESSNRENIDIYKRVDGLKLSQPHNEIRHIRHSKVFHRPNVDQKSKSSSLTITLHDRESLLKAITKHNFLVFASYGGFDITSQLPELLHEAGYSESGPIVFTQPSQAITKSFEDIVSRQMDCYGELVTNGTMKIVTEESFLREAHRNFYSILAIDVGLQKTPMADVILHMVKDSRRNIIMLCTPLQAKKLSSFYENAPVFYISGRTNKVGINYIREDMSATDLASFAVNLVIQLHDTEEAGDIMVFLTDEDQVKLVQRKLRRTAGLSTIATEEYETTHDGSGSGSRIAILATTIDEKTLLAVGNVRFVVDLGFYTETAYNSVTGLESIVVKRISKVVASQRAALSGRTYEGMCFRLYTAHTFSELDEDSTPMIKRTNLAQFILTLKAVGILKVNEIEFVDPPSVEAVTKAEELLFALGAVDGLGNLTDTGKIMAKFLVNPMLSKMIVASAKFKCSIEIITIAAMLLVGGFNSYYPKDSTTKDSEHISLLKVYNAWKETDFSAQWCAENDIKLWRMESARSFRDQLKKIFEKAEIQLTSNLDNLDVVKKAIISGCFPNFARLQKDGSYRTIKSKQEVHIHPSSALKKALPRWVVYQELVLTTKKYVMHKVSEVKPEWLLEIAPHYYGTKDIEDCSGVDGQMSNFMRGM